MFDVKEIIAATQGRLLQGSLQKKVQGVSIDSRKVAAGELFMAIKGDIFDGHDFVLDVIQKGIKVVVVHRPLTIKQQDVSVILVEDTLKALGGIARYHRLRFSTPVIAITGSAGKTTTKEMIAAVLAGRFNVLKNIGTENNHIGVPLTILKLNAQHEMLVLECGTNQPGDIAWLSWVASPTMAVMINVGESHLERLKTPMGVLREKWNLVDALPSKAMVIYNADDTLISKKVRTCSGHQFKGYSIQKRSSCQATSIKVIDGIKLQFKAQGQVLRINSCGISNIYNALAALTCGLIFKVAKKDIKAALANFQFPSGRGQIVRLGRGWLINDVYNANPVSMRSALQTLEALSTRGKRIFVAADMLELGQRSKSLHEDVGRAISKSRVNVLITVGPLSKHMAFRARQNKALDVAMFDDATGAQTYLSKVLKNGDVVLVKGSRRMKMETVVDYLLASPDSGLN